ncbi:hypothetical protein P4O66_012561 [Electrophorus voltai]|uniref:PDZ domain-containing protein n=1 Tax=Electrophorus voltai TaxID=2609070 RepID=A0AAD8Z6Z9_9TELE|nr:hypothetical protein P4O66_012561 [Electrophorus voltai]
MSPKLFTHMPKQPTLGCSVFLQYRFQMQPKSMKNISQKQPIRTAWVRTRVASSYAFPQLTLPLPYHLRRSGPPETTQHSKQEQASYWSHILERYGNLPGELKMVELDCSTHSSGLGVCVTGSRDPIHGRMSVYVSDVWQDGAVAADGRIRVGDELLETDSSPILSPSAVDIIMFKEGKHYTLNQKGRAVLEDKQRAYSEKNSFNHPISSNTSSNHKPPSDPVSTFYSSSASHIPPSCYIPPTSHDTAANHSLSIHHTPSLCSSLANPSGIGLPSSSCCPSCSGCSDPLTHPIIPGFLNIIDICKGPSGLGLTVVGGCNTLLLTLCSYYSFNSSGKVFHKAFYKRVNGIDLRMATHEEALSILRLSPHLVRLCVYRHPCAHTTHTFQNQAPHVQEDMWDLFMVGLQIGPRQSLGLNIVSKRNDTGIFVSEIMKGGVVALDGRLLPGDQILSVNGEDIRAVTLDYARTLLQNCRGSVILEMVRFKANQHKSYECQGSCDSPGLRANAPVGLKEDTGLYTSAIELVQAATPTGLLEGAAAKDGRLRPGDQLLAVNGRSLQGVTHTEAIAILRQAGSRVTLTILSPTPATRI